MPRFRPLEQLILLLNLPVDVSQLTLVIRQGSNQSFELQATSILVRIGA
jgi:hypothetical protein